MTVDEGRMNVAFVFVDKSSGSVFMKILIRELRQSAYDECDANIRFYHTSYKSPVEGSTFITAHR